MDSIEVPTVLPVLALRDVVVFPYIILPLSVRRDSSVAAVDEALVNERFIMLTAQHEATIEQPTADDIYEYGTAAVIMRMLKLPDERIRILVQGVSRARIKHVRQTEPFLRAQIETVEEPEPPPPSMESEALLRSVKENLERIASLGRVISPDVMIIAANLDDPGRLADLAASNLDLKLEEAQQLLEEVEPEGRLHAINEYLVREVQLLTMQREISTQARGEMDRSQREYFLRQQLKTIQQELGEGEELTEEIAGYRRLASEKKLPTEAMSELDKQLKRLERTHPESAETGVIRTYIEWLTGMPWSTVSEDLLELDRARRILDEDHYDLEKIKERIVEYLAVRKLNPESRGPILCFVGPPGVGKTSLGRSIARALGREFVRLSLGGVRDEAEIRGHRRTYVGALPGRIIQGLHRAKTSNPVFMLDEIDKTGSDYRGDISSALLEVLDPEQNFNFRDHYLGVAYDLSRVLFIATANLLEPIQPAFLDRMEIIRLTGYTDAEKMKIAERYLIPKQLKEHGLTRDHLMIRRPSLRRVVHDYTKEAGVRGLEREIASICRKAAVRVAEGEAERMVVTPEGVAELLGPAKHFSEELLDQDKVGVATGLAWTAAGGDLLFIEVLAVTGKGRLILTGQLGDVMKESAQAAMSFARRYFLDEDLEGDLEELDFHVHVPAGSIPKDGPSAGITIATALISVLTDRPINRRVAMTGEITLRGDVLPIGGLKEKVLAAKGAGIKTVIIPELNRRDLAEIAEPLKRGITFKPVEHLRDVLEIALRKQKKKPATKN